MHGHAFRRKWDYTHDNPVEESVQDTYASVIADLEVPLCN
jgi:hypothetical protein